MSFSGFSDVEINQYESSFKKKKSLGPKISSTSHKSVKHVPLKAEIEDEEDEEHSIDKVILNIGTKKTEEPLIPVVEEIENKEVLIDSSDLLGVNDFENEELIHLPKPLSLADSQKIEDENKKLKAIILDAVKQRKEKSNLEAEKLKEIQVELAKLDEIVGSDVKIIRKDIEGVTQHLSEARKRFERVEKEYVKAKLDLHSHEERKNNLTDYLCFIITENETRKSERLRLLMKELNF
uniref:RAB6-interacting golgin n=1 Tax=Lepeophtheirus salmonis TaxID=72036 RepID=A0A0K2SV88_LEPSM